MLRTQAPEATTGIISAPDSLPMTRFWRTIRDYILWSYERGSIQYDVMVTLILVFIFLSPRWIDFKDKPLPHNPHRTEVVVGSDGNGGLIFQIDGSLIKGKEDDEVQTDLLQIIEPIAGNVAITNYVTDRDRSGRVRTYRVWARKR